MTIDNEKLTKVIARELQAINQRIEASRKKTEALEREASDFQKLIAGSSRIHLTRKEHRA